MAGKVVNQDFVVPDYIGTWWGGGRLYNDLRLGKYVCVNSSIGCVQYREW